MRPDDRDLEDEIRSALELSIRERIERGEDPRSARQAALEEFGSMAPSATRCIGSGTAAGPTPCCCFSRKCESACVLFCAPADWPSPWS